MGSWEEPACHRSDIGPCGLALFPFADWFVNRPITFHRQLFLFIAFQIGRHPRLKNSLRLGNFAGSF